MSEYLCGDCKRYFGTDEWSGECSKHGMVNCMSNACKDFKEAYPTEKGNKQ